MMPDMSVGEMIARNCEDDGVGFHKRRAEAAAFRKTHLGAALHAFEQTLSRAVQLDAQEHASMTKLREAWDKSDEALAVLTTLIKREMGWNWTGVGQ